MNKICKNCQAQFEITEEDLKFYDKVSPVFNGKRYLIPPPTLCPNCRSQRRLSFRDERKLYRRKCDFSGKDIFSIYSSDKDFVVYSNTIWWGDSWDGLNYGRDFNSSRTFFEQFYDLKKTVPRMQNTEYSNENCPYINRNAHCKNCYMCFSFDESENCYYSEHSFKLKSCIDCGTSEYLELCIGCIECNKLFKCTDCLRCSSLSDSSFCFDCHNSDNLILCWNLNQKKYCILNEQYSEKEFFKKKKEMNMDSSKGIDVLKKEFKQIIKQEAIHKFARIVNSENCTGSNILHSKDCKECFEISKCEKLKYVNYVPNDVKFSMDCMAIWDNAELCYESISVSSYNVQFCSNVWESNDIIYCDTLKSCNNCFGCTGLKHKSYCILNQQYTKEEYEKLVPKIIEHMKSTNEFGEFFPTKHSPFGYNESVANEYFPLKRVEALYKNYDWHDEPPKSVKTDCIELPDRISHISDDICNKTLYCENSNTNYKISKYELDIYRTLIYPIPTTSPNLRYKDRLSYRLPWSLWERKCNNCDNIFKTNFHPGREEKVYCEECYLNEVY